jgi:selenium donor protein
LNKNDMSRLESSSSASGKAPVTGTGACDRIYFDHNATTPLLPEVASAMRRLLEEPFGNPSSLHWAGVPARSAVDAARLQIASFLGCKTTEVIFTSGGTEANNCVLKGVFFAQRGEVRRPHIVTSQIEHPSVLSPCRFLEELGADVSYLSVDRFGRVDPADVLRAIRPETILISVMHANNEVGTIQPIEEIARLARAKGVLCHTDAAQTAGKIPVDVRLLGVDLLTVAGHKLYGPKGVGALFVRAGVKFQPLLHGADHEAARRAGTENVAGIVGLGAACALALECPHESTLRDYFWQRLQETFGDRVLLNGHPRERLPNTLNVSFRGLVGGDILAALPHVAASTGSACHAGSVGLSPVLRAMGVSEEVGMGAIRFSLGRASTAAEVDRVVEQLRLSIGNVDATASIRSAGCVPAHKECLQAADEIEGARQYPVDTSVRLTQMAKRAGCAAKQPPGYLLPLLGHIPAFNDPNVLVGSATADDAAVYKLSDDLALVVTTDFFTPIVDAPHDFGAIAAANALSDVYAMGARPLLALNLVGFPDEKLPVGVLANILRGAADKAAEAGIAIVGGHTIKSEEPTFGLCVVGTVHPEKVLTNAGARPGDVLVLTKPIGVGVITTAAKNNEDLLSAIGQAIHVMSTLNKAAADLMAEFDVHALTDVTGFGLLGHLRNVTSASRVHARIWADAVPIIPAARDYARMGIVPGGTHANWRFLQEWVTYGDGLAKEDQLLLCDAQTSGGLLACVRRDESDALVRALQNAGVETAAVVGQIEVGPPGKITVSLNPE